jgi:hypothetical protein
LLAYAKQFSQEIGHIFTRETIRVTALTGTAASDIGGETTSKEFSLLNGRDFATADDIADFTDTRMNVVDEISFAGYNTDLRKLSIRLKAFTQCHEFPFGSIPIVFLGDFCQLEPINGDCIYKQENGLLWEQALTDMVELEGTHRYRNCPTMSDILPNMRNHGLSDENRNILNKRVIDGKGVKMPTELSTAQFATFFNKKRCGINSGMFHAYLKANHGTCDESNIPTTAIVIKGNPRFQRNDCPFSFDARKVVFEECSENDITTGKQFTKRINPMLCLFSKCPTMGTHNTDVKNGIANGTTAVFEKAVLKPGKYAHPMQLHGCWVYAVDVGDVDHLQMRWKDSRFEGTFKVKAITTKCNVKLPVYEFGTRLVMDTPIKLDHFPFTINHATTGHKLQGKSLEELIIAEWSNVRNWSYVVLSRVKSLSGLFLMTPIPLHINFAPDPQYLSMMDRLRGSILALPDQISNFTQQVRLEHPNL